MSRTCRNCGHRIRRSPWTLTGWTHNATNWQGIRCPGQLVGAQPVAWWRRIWPARRRINP